jgi:hypothetical protein
MSGPHQVRTDHSYPYCEGHDGESDNAEGWCSQCNMFVSEYREIPMIQTNPGSVREIMSRFDWTVIRDTDPETGNERVAA